MKAILMSDRPKWCALMMNDIKKIEVRKGTALYKAIQKLIDEYGYADIYVYCSMAKHIKDYLQIKNGKYVCDVPKDYESELNGKVIFKFRCYKVEEIPTRRFSICTYPYTETLDDYELLDKSCLSTNELETYLGDKTGYAIHISDLEIFDKPKELSEFQGTCNSCEAFRLKVCKLNREKCDRHLTKAPQSFMYIEM